MIEFTVIMSNVYLDSIKSILRTHDPVGLISQGAPDDEYDHEALMVANIRFDSHEDLTNKIHEIFVERFNRELAGEKSKYSSIADEIISKSDFKTVD